VKCHHPEPAAGHQRECLGIVGIWCHSRLRSWSFT
jgi:hypothetical protein